MKTLHQKKQRKMRKKHTSCIILKVLGIVKNYKGKILEGKQSSMPITCGMVVYREKIWLNMLTIVVYYGYVVKRYISISLKIWSVDKSFTDLWSNFKNLISKHQNSYYHFTQDLFYFYLYAYMCLYVCIHMYIQVLTESRRGY